MIRILLTLFIFVLASSAKAGVYELLSQGSYRLYKGSCSQLDEAQATPKLAETAQQCLQPFYPQIPSTMNVEDKFFALLSKKSQENLICQRAKLDFLTNDPEKFIPKARMMIELRKQLGQLTAKMTLHKAKLHSRPKWEGGALIPDEKYIELENSIRQTAAALAAAKASIPMSNFPGLIDAIESYALIPDQRKMTDFIWSVRFKLNASSAQLSQADQKPLPRHIKEELMSDPALYQQLFAKKPELQKDLEPLICQMDAKYGFGAKARDVNLFLGSFLTAGGLALRGWSIGGQAIAAGATQARAAGMISQSAMRITQAASVGLGSLQIYQSLDRACFQNTTLTLMNDCSSPESVMKQIEQDSCVLNVLLTALVVDMNMGGLTAKAVKKYLLSSNLPPPPSAPTRMSLNEVEQAFAKLPKGETHAFPTTGIEVEMLIPRFISTNRIVKNLQEVIVQNGGKIENVVGSTIHYIKDGKTQTLSLKRDGSVHRSAWYRDGELVSGIIDSESEAKLYLDAVDRLKKLGARPHRSAGLHVHSGLPELTVEESVAVQEAFRQIEGKLVQNFRQYINRKKFAGSVDEVDSFRLSEMARRFPGGNLAVTMERAHYAFDRYRNLNLQSIRAHGTGEIRLFNSTLDRKSIEFMRNLSGSFFQAVRNRDPKLLDYYKRLGQGESFEMRNLSEAIGMKYSAPEVEKIMASLTAEARKYAGRDSRHRAELLEAMTVTGGGTFAVFIAMGAVSHIFDDEKSFYSRQFF